MKPGELFRELIYPMTDMAIVMSMLFFGLLFGIARLGPVLSGLLGLMLALFLLAIVVPPFSRYLLFLLEARANGQQAPALDAELFGMSDKLWAMTPLVLVALLIWGGILMSGYGSVLSSIYSVSMLVLFPASVAILAITHSPLESLNPLAIGRMIHACGPAYFLVPTTVLAVHLGLAGLSAAGLWSPLVFLGNGYETIILFTLTGAILKSRDVAVELQLADPLEPTRERLAADLEKERQKVASHAYGFISRGNREGGFAHIMDWIGQEPDVHEASAWFFNTMLKWESKDPALFYAQTYLSHLLHHDEEAKVLKLISVCLHENPAWKPNIEDRPHALALAEKHRRDDLVRSLRN